MDTVAHDNTNEIRFPRAYVHHALEGNLLDAGLSLVASPQGFRALWTNADTKQPITSGGVADATRYGSELYAMHEVIPEHIEPALAMVTPSGAAVVDWDADKGPRPLGLPTGRSSIGPYETTRGGAHWFTALPAQVDLVSSHDSGELRAGPNSYTIVCPSPGKEAWRAAGGAFNMLPWPLLPEDGSLWLNYLRAGVRREHMAEIIARDITQADRRQADTITTNLLKGRFGSTVTAILRGEIEDRYPSRSEADFALLFMATHFDASEGCLAELLFRHSRKLRDKHTAASQSSYISSTVSAALATRSLTDYTRLANIAQILHFSTLPFSIPHPTPPHSRKVCMLPENGIWVVGGMAERRKKERGEMLAASILEWAGRYGAGDGYDWTDGWRRLPVEDMGAIHGYGREGVRTKVLALIDAGFIERRLHVAKCDKGHDRRTTLIRLTKGAQR